MKRYCRDLMAPRLCQFTEILQRFYGAPTMSIYRDFMVPPTMSIYRDFMVPRLCQFTEISWCPDYVILQRFHGAPDYVNLQRFHGAPDYVNLQRFHGAPTMSIYRDFAEILDQFLFLWNRARFRQVGLGSKTTPESSNQHQIGPNPLVCSNHCRARSL